MSSQPFHESAPEDDSDDIVTLVDDDDNEITFQILGLVDVDGAEYALLTPVATEGDQMDIYIFHYDVDEEADTVTYGSVDDPDLFQRVVARAEELITFGDGEE